MEGIMKRADTGVRFWDVAEWIDHCERAHDVAIHFHICRPIMRSNGKALTIRVVAQRDSDKGVWRYERGVSGHWPWSEAATFAGAMLRLVIQLDEVLTEDEKRATLKQGDLFGAI